MQALALCSCELQHGCSIKQRQCASAGAVLQFQDQLLPPRTSNWLPFLAGAVDRCLMLYAEMSIAGGTPDVCFHPSKVVGSTGGNLGDSRVTAHHTDLAVVSHGFSLE